VTAGLTILALPMILYWIVASRVSRIFPALAFEGRGAATCVAIGAGVVAYLAVPAFLYLEGGAAPVLITLTVAITLIAFLLGRALDPTERLHGSFAVLACLFAMAVVAAFLLGTLPWLVGTTLALALAFGGLQLASLPRSESALGTEAEASRPPESAPLPYGSPVELAARAVEPAFQPTGAVERAWQKLAPFREGQAMRLGLVGGPGSGLSRSLLELVKRLEASAAQAGQKLVVLANRARPQGGRGAPYQPFREALRQHFAVDLLVTPESEDGQLGSSLGGLLETLVPFGSLLVPHASDMASQTSKQNLFASVHWMLRRVARGQPVALVLDNVQDFDAASQELLAYVARHLPVGTPEPVLLIAASHDAAALEAAGFDQSGEIVHLPYPSAEEQVEILRGGVGLEQATAETIVDRVGVASAATGGMTWLLQIVGELARAGVLAKEATGFALPGGRWPSEVELPNEMAQVVRQHLDAHPAYRRTLAAAACAAMGREFEVQTLTQVLEESRLDLLTQLDAIQSDTGIVRDVRERDDVYAFSSTFMLDVVREELGIRDAGPHDPHVPQIVRELHARVAQALESEIDQNPEALFRVADHYYAAGTRQAARAYHWSARAARVHAALADFEGSERDLDRVDAVARTLGLSEEGAELRLIIQAQRAHVTGDPELRARAARDGAQHVDRRADPSIELLLATGQAHYDAGKSKGDGTYLSEAARFGQRIVERASTPVEEAAGHHLVGVSLPLSDREGRIRELERALELLEGYERDDADATRLLGRVLGSLAEERMRGGDAEESVQARAILERRLELLTTSGVGDPRGLAMTHGALGRLALLVEPRDLRRAREHFEKDLEMSEAIGDRDGQVHMHSLLGACALEDGAMDLAREHYLASWRLSSDGVSRIFAGAGLLRTHAAQGDLAAVADVVTALTEALPRQAASLPAEAAKALSVALGMLPDEARSEAVDRLSKRLLA
jgi:tetratricopeptide (TPR) repeat protein